MQRAKRIQDETHIVIDNGCRVPGDVMQTADVSGAVDDGLRPELFKSFPGLIQIRQIDTIKSRDSGDGMSGRLRARR